MGKLIHSMTTPLVERQFRAINVDVERPILSTATALKSLSYQISGISSGNYRFGSMAVKVNENHRPIAKEELNRMTIRSDTQYFWTIHLYGHRP